jgi:hypothetical protein
MKEVYRIKQTVQFKKDLKRPIKQGKDVLKLQEVVDTSVEGKLLGATLFCIMRNTRLQFLQVEMCM